MGCSMVARQGSNLLLAGYGGQWGDGSPSAAAMVGQTRPTWASEPASPQSAVKPSPSAAHTAQPVKEVHVISTEFLGVGRSSQHL